MSLSVYLHLLHFHLLLERCHHHYCRRRRRRHCRHHHHMISIVIEFIPTQFSSLLLQLRSLQYNISRSC